MGIDGQAFEEKTPLEGEQKFLEQYLASAGSGKTRALSLKYIELALRRPAQARSYRHIVALTFTKKATEEMCKRILSMLDALRKEASDPDTKGLARELAAACRLDEATIRRRAEETLLLLLHDYGHFSVSTIDAFFQRVFRSFLLEESVSLGHELVLDTKEALAEGVEALFSRLEEDQQLRAWTLSWLSERSQGGKSWNLEAPLLDFGQELFKERYLLVRPEKNQATAYSTACSNACSNS